MEKHCVNFFSNCKILLQWINAAEWAKKVALLSWASLFLFGAEERLTTYFIYMLFISIYYFVSPTRLSGGHEFPHFQLEKFDNLPQVPKMIICQTNIWSTLGLIPKVVLVPLHLKILSSAITSLFHLDCALQDGISALGRWKREDQEF